MSKIIFDTIEKAINHSQTLNLTVKHGLGSIIKDTEFQPYILGNDTYQYSIVWGYLPHQGLFYKFRLDDIAAAKIETNSFAISPDACYQHASEEEHFAIIDSFSNIYARAARTAISKGFKVKQFILTLGENTNVMHVAAVPGTNKTSGKQGYIALGYKANQPKTPTDTKGSIELANTLFDTAEEALKEGQKIMTTKSKYAYNEAKKRSEK